jgi:hypothetical protein
LRGLPRKLSRNFQKVLDKKKISDYLIENETRRGMTKRFPNQVSKRKKTK